MQLGNNSNNDGTYTATLTSATTAGTATIIGTVNVAAITDNATVSFTQAATETIVITKATYSSRKNQLKIEATSSLGGDTGLSATYFVDGPESFPPKDMSYNAKKNKWSVTFDSDDGLTTKPDKVRVSSTNTFVETANIGGK